MLAERGGDRALLSPARSGSRCTHSYPTGTSIQALSALVVSLITPGQGLIPEAAKRLEEGRRKPVAIRQRWTTVRGNRLDDDDHVQLDIGDPHRDLHSELAIRSNAHSQLHASHRPLLAVIDGRTSRIRIRLQHSDAVKTRSGSTNEAEVRGVARHDRAKRVLTADPGLELEITGLNPL